MTKESNGSRGAGRLRELLKRGGLIRTLSCYDPMTARMAEMAGFEAVAISGSLVGASRCAPEPTLTMTEMVETARQFTLAIDAPIKLDCGAGFGDPIHVQRTVREAEAVGAACVGIEDQIFPKRAHYHLGVERLISAEEMADKVRAAVAARRNPDFAIVARTDAVRTHGIGEAIRRANLYAEAGCDMVHIFPSNQAELQLAPREIGVPLVTACAPGGDLYKSLTRFVSFSEFEDLGYRMAIDSKSVMIAAVAAVRQLLDDYAHSGTPPEGYLTEGAAVRAYINDIAGIQHLYALERDTTEK